MDKEGRRHILAELSAEAHRAIAIADQVHHPIGRFLRRIGRTKTDFLCFVNQHNSDLLQNIEADAAGPPRLYHKIWLTGEDRPAMPPDNFLRKLIRSFNGTNDWTLMFWTNHDEVRAKVGSALKGNVHSLILGDVKTTFENDLLYPTIQRFLAVQKYVVAGDVLKIALLSRFGGVYADLGLQLSLEVLDVLSIIDYAFLLGHAVFLQTSLIASKPQGRLMNLITAAMLRPEAYSRECIVTSATISATDEIRAFSGVGATMASVLFSKPTDRILFLPTKSKHFEWEAQGSWYKKDGVSGNVVVSETEPTILSEAGYIDASTRDQLVVAFNLSPLRRERLAILSRVQDKLGNSASADVGQQSLMSLMWAVEADLRQHRKILSAAQANVLDSLDLCDTAMDVLLLQNDQGFQRCADLVDSIVKSGRSGVVVLLADMTALDVNCWEVKLQQSQIEAALWRIETTYFSSQNLIIWL